MIIKVTPEDISKGKRNNPDFCPIALALKRSYGLTDSFQLIFDKIRVNSHFISWIQIRGDDNFACDKIETPIEVVLFIEDFDAGKLVPPFEFDLDFIPFWTKVK